MPDATPERSVVGKMTRCPEHDVKPLTNIFNLQSPLWRIPPFISMRRTGTPAADGATSTIRVQLPDAPQFQKSEVILMTATRVAQQLIHAALDVVAPLERFSYLSGVLDGYKLAREEVEGQQFRVQNKDDVQEHSRA